jgi:site-specific recombinase XerD
MSETLHDFRVYLEATGRSEITIKNYTRSIEWLMEFIEDPPLQRISGKDICSALTKIKRASNSVSERSAATMNRIISACRIFFKWAFYSGLSFHDYMFFLNLKKVHSDSTTPISSEETETFLNTIHNSNDAKAFRDEVLFSIYSFTGIRRSEALQLKVSDYDSVSSTLLLRHTKGGKNRKQPVPNRIKEILNRYLKTLRNGREPVDNIFLFPGRVIKRHISTRQVNERFLKWKNLSGIRKNLTIHSFRAGFATRLYQSSKDALLVSRALGHSDFKTTEHYIADNMSIIQNEVEKTILPVN